MPNGANAAVMRPDAMPAPINSHPSPSRGLLAACGLAFAIGIAAGGAAYGFAPRAQKASVIVPDAPATVVHPFTPPASPQSPSATPSGLRRIAGIAGEDLNAAMRIAGVPEPLANDYLKALATRIDLSRGISVVDRFDLVIASPPTSTDAGPRLLYAGLDRVGASDLQLLRWSVDRRPDWIDASGSGTQVAGLAWPVPARISSGFGMRMHPLLGFLRMHRGVDLRASWGAPIVAAADGRVAAAGWSGGYGKQVQIIHAGGIATSYSHMSRIAAAPGQMVRQGQVIGFVGSTGLSTGPHLHYEVSRNGRPVNPMGIGIASTTRVDPRDREAFRATMRQLLMLKPGPAAA